MAGLFAGLPLELFLSPWLLALLGLIVGSFLNVVVHRLPLLLERQWWGDVAAQLADADSFKRVFNSAAPERLALASGGLEKAIAGLAPLGLARPASRCPACGHRIRWYENIPLLSWLVLRGRCAACAAPISPRYPFIEALTAVLFAAVAWAIALGNHHRPSALLLSRQNLPYAPKAALDDNGQPVRATTPAIRVNFSR